MKSYAKLFLISAGVSFATAWLYKRYGSNLAYRMAGYITE